MIRLQLVICLLVGGLRVSGQELAFFVSTRGAVRVKTASGSEADATLHMKLRDGDQITTGTDGTATLMYYSGREVILGSRASHKVVQKNEPGVLARLAGVLSGMLSGESSKDLVGATRAWASDSNRILVPVYPSETRVMEKEPVFEWHDKRGGNDREYVVVIRGLATDFEYEISVKGVTRVAYPSTAPPLLEVEKYAWSIRDVAAEYASTAVHFSLLKSEERTELQQELSEILVVCNSDNTHAQWHLLSSAVYRRFLLMRQAENSIRLLIASKPDMVQAHIMLATLCKETGRFEEAKAEEEIIRKMTLK